MAEEDKKGAPERKEKAPAEKGDEKAGDKEKKSDKREPGDEKAGDKEKKSDKREPADKGGRRRGRSHSRSRRRRRSHSRRREAAKKAKAASSAGSGGKGPKAEATKALGAEPKTSAEKAKDAKPAGAAPKAATEGPKKNKAPLSSSDEYDEVSEEELLERDPEVPVDPAKEPKQQAAQNKVAQASKEPSRHQTRGYTWCFHCKRNIGGGIMGFQAHQSSGSHFAARSAGQGPSKAEQNTWKTPRSRSLPAQDWRAHRSKSVPAEPFRGQRWRSASAAARSQDWHGKAWQDDRASKWKYFQDSSRRGAREEAEEDERQRRRKRPVTPSPDPPRRESKRDRRSPPPGGGGGFGDADRVKIITGMFEQTLRAVSRW